MPAERFTLRWDGVMGCYRVSEPNIEGPVEVVTAEAYERVRNALEALVEASEQFFQPAEPHFGVAPVWPRTVDARKVLDS